MKIYAKTIKHLHSTSKMDTSRSNLLIRFTYPLSYKAGSAKPQRKREIIFSNFYSIYSFYSVALQHSERSIMQTKLRTNNLEIAGSKKTDYKRQNKNSNNRKVFNHLQRFLSKFERFRGLSNI